jgi:hypothetical protein
MDIRSFLFGDLDMANKTVANAQRVIDWVETLNRCGTDKAAHDKAFAALSSDVALTAGELQAIAVKYRGGGTKPTSKKASLEVVAKRFLELRRNKTQLEQASKSRPW